VVDSEDLVLLYRAPDAEEAALLVSVLDAHHVPARTVGGSARWGFGELGMDALRVEIWVPTEVAASGRSVIERYYAQLESDNPALAWSCAGCGEVNDGGFEVCWQCQGFRSEAPEVENNDPPFDPQAPTAQ
jgi:hypothetical protein